MSRSGVKFLTGAPVAGTLDWREDGLLNVFCSAMQRYLDSSHVPSATPAPSQPVASWRAIPLTTRTFYESPAVQRNSLQHAFSVTKNHVPKDKTVDQEEDFDFLEHSFAVHADLQSSQLAPQPGSQDPESTFLTESSIKSTFIDESTSFLGETTIEPTQLFNPSLRTEQRAISGPVMNVKAIPTSDYLQRLQPQTMTVNLIVSIISIAPARTVRVRRGGYDMEIVEILVGDDTKAGFTISSWHAPLESQSKSPDQLRKTLQSLRPQDVILVERIALSSFNNQVYGQSLNRRATKNTTAITVLHKARESQRNKPQQANLSPFIENKIERVKEWASSFVGPSNKRTATSEPSGSRTRQATKRRKALMEEEFLPPDSQ